MRRDTFVGTREEIALLKPNGGTRDIAAARHDDITVANGEVDARGDTDRPSEDERIADRGTAQQHTAGRGQIKDGEATSDGGRSRASLVD